MSAKFRNTLQIAEGIGILVNHEPPKRIGGVEGIEATAFCPEGERYVSPQAKRTRYHKIVAHDFIGLYSKYLLTTTKYLFKILWY